jgi:hypothetical protein
MVSSHPCKVTVDCTFVSRKAAGRISIIWTLLCLCTVTTSQEETGLRELGTVARISGFWRCLILKPRECELCLRRSAVCFLLSKASPDCPCFIPFTAALC